MAKLLRRKWKEGGKNGTNISNVLLDINFKMTFQGGTDIALSPTRT